LTKFVIHSLTSLYVNVRVNFAAYATRLRLGAS